MTGKEVDDTTLDALFDGARASRAAPAPDFMARLSADAEAHIPRTAAKGAARPQGFNWLAGVFATSGLAGAAIAGVWIGFAMPDALDTLDFGAETTVALSSFLPGADLGAIFDE